MKKHLFLKSLLIAIGLLIASCPQLWATWYLKGGFNDWGTGNDITSGVTTVTINSTGDYKFKIHDGDGTWYGCNGTISSTEGDWVFYTDHGDCTLRVSTTGTYTFGWNATSHVVTVIFPGENSKKTLPKQKYIYFDVRSETYWNAAAFTARYWFKNYATGVDIGSGVECSTPLENWVYYAAVPNNDNVGRIQINRIKNSDTDGTTNVVYAWSRGSTSQNCLKEETGKTNYKDSWTPQWTTYCPIKKTSVISDNSTVTYGGNGGSSTPYKVEKGGTINVSASSTDYISDGNMTTKYAFYVGASKNQDGTGTTYSYTASATAGTTHQLKVNSYNYYNSTSSTAKYSDILYYTTITCYTVTYNKNGATDGTIPAVSGTKYESGTNVTLATNTGSLAKDGYSFNGWNTAPGGGGTHYDAGGTLSSIGANTTLYAEWSASPGVSLSAAKTSGINVGETVRLTATGSNASNITKYDFYEGSTKVYTATTSSGTATYDYTPSVAGNKTMKVIMTYNSGSNTETSNNVALTLNVPSVSSLTEANTTTEMWIGVDATAALTFTAASNNVSSGATVTWTASDASSGTFSVTSSSYSGATITYTPASTGAKTVTVTMTIGGNTYTRTYNLTVYERWNIYVQKNCGDWTKIALYQFNNGTNADWPGVTGASTACAPYGNKNWYKVTLDSYYPKFILDNNQASSGIEQTTDCTTGSSSGTYTSGTYWYFVYDGTTTDSKNDGKKYYTLTKYTLSAPTVGLTATVTNTNQINLTGNISAYGGYGSSASDMEEVYFNVNNTKDAASITVSTTNGNFTKTLNNPTPDNTNNTLQAYASNIKGTGNSSAIRFTKITLDKQSGSGGTTNVLAVNGVAMASGAMAPTRSGYTFGGYFESTGGADRQYYNANMTSANTWNQTTATKTIYAKWTANTWYVRFNRNGGTTGSDMANESFTYDAAAKALTTNTYTRSGYAFSGWATSEERANAGMVDYEDEAEVRNLTAAAGGIFDLYAVWTANNYTVSFDVNGGTSSTPDSKSVTFGSAYGTLPGGMTHASKTFIGWYDDSRDGEGNHITAETTVSIADDHTLYAHYENVYSVNVTFKCGSATIYPATSVNASSTSLMPTITAPEIFGYTFTGWTESGGSYVTFTNASAASTTIKTSGAATVVANYDVVPTVYFKNNLGWDSVFVTFDCGFNSGKENVPHNNGKPYFKMTQIGSTDIYYCEIPSTYTTSDYSGWAYNIAFDNTNYGKTGSTTHTGTWDAFFGGECIGRGDFDPKTTLYIPYSEDTETRNSAKYYKTGCWMKYNSTESGYQVNMNTWVTGSNADTLTVKLEAANAGGYEFSAKLNLKHPNYTYGFKLYKIYQKNDNDLWYTNCPATISSTTDDLPWHFWSGSSVTSTSDRCGLHTEALGDYIITVSFATGRPEVNVEYPASVGDWRLAYNDRIAWSGSTHDGSWYLYSRVIKAKADAEDLVSFYVSKAVGANAHIELQKCTAIDAGTGAETWTKQGDNLDLSSITGTGIYNFKVTQNGSKVATAAYDGAYDGNFYIRTDASDGGWNNYIGSGKNIMTYSEYAEENSGFSHYFMRYVTSGSNIKFCIANDYSECLTEYCVSDTYTNEYIEANGNVRFMWDHRTNAVSRAYISGSTNVSDRFLVLEGDAKLFDASGQALTTAGGGKISGLNDNEMRFTDDQNWIYEATVKAQPKAKVKLTAKYNSKIQYFYGDEGTDAEDSVLLLDGAGTDKYKMRIVYDFKTNRLIKAFIPDGTINADLAINADMMIIREHQEDAQQISFGESGKLSAVKTVYGAMKFNKYTVNGKSKAEGHAATGESRYKRDLFYISFPFDVKLSEVFGFGTYGKHWIIEYYDGKGRAKNGFWADSEPNWKFVMPAERHDFTMKAFEGYILALALGEMTESSSVWDNGVDSVYVYFPSADSVKNIRATNRLIDIDQDGYECTINRSTPDGDRRVKDSYWHCIGVPSFANYSSTLYDGNGGSAIDWSDDDGTIDWSTPSLPYLYVWDWSDNSLDVTTSATFSFKATWSYLVQYAGDHIYWSQVNATPAAIVARQRMAPKNAEFRIELQKDGQKADQTFVRLTQDENVTTGYDFNYDLSKEFKSKKANIYTMVTTQMEDGPSITEVAGNVQPMTEQTTVIPMGVKIATNGDYTFSIPEGTDGIGVTLVDNETGIRTSLSALDYTINLSAGTYDNRFVLEISPIKETPTGVEEVTGDGLQVTGVRKVLIDGVLYIVKDNKMYDARGNRIQ